MRFGLFGGAQAVPGEVVTEAALGYHEYGEYIKLAEKLGYSSAWLLSIVSNTKLPLLSCGHYFENSPW